MLSATQRSGAAPERNGRQPDGAQRGVDVPRQRPIGALDVVCVSRSGGDAIDRARSEAMPSCSATVALPADTDWRRTPSRPSTRMRPDFGRDLVQYGAQQGGLTSAVPSDKAGADRAEGQVEIFAEFAAVRRGECQGL